MIKILIADDNKDFAEALKYSLEKDPELSVQGIANDGQQAVELTRCNAPDIILMDIQMPGCSGVEAVAKVKNYNKNIKVIMLTTFDEDKSIAEALENGADGYVLKEIETPSLLQIIKNTHSGLTVMQDCILTKVKNLLSQQSVNKHFEDKEKNEIPFSDTEISIIKSIVQGKGNQEIAQELNYSTGTIKNRVSKILEKAQLKDRTQLAVYAVKNKIT